MARDLLPFDRQPWADQAACLGVGPDRFFPERYEPVDQAKEFCRGCPVKRQCLEYALANRERWGIWGGKSERQRRRIRTHRNRSAAA